MKKFSVLLLHLLLLLILCCSICCVEGSSRANLSGGGELASGQRWWALQGPCTACLGSSLSYAGNMAGSGRFVLVRHTDGKCAVQGRWWGLRWCSVIPAEGSSTSSPGRVEGTRRERDFGMCKLEKWQHCGSTANLSCVIVEQLEKLTLMNKRIMSILTTDFQ